MSLDTKQTTMLHNINKFEVRRLEELERQQRVLEEKEAEIKQLQEVLANQLEKIALDRQELVTKKSNTKRYFCELRQELFEEDE